jgi:hypothetical protein
MRQDTLSARKSAGQELTEAERYALVDLLGGHCKQETKDKLYRRLPHVSLLSSRGIFDRVILSPRVSYCAGQSYPDEIRTVRNLILNG